MMTSTKIFTGALVATLLAVAAPFALGWYREPIAAIVVRSCGTPIALAVVERDGTMKFTSADTLAGLDYILDQITHHLKHAKAWSINVNRLCEKRAPGIEA